MALRGFLQVPDIQGESQTADHENEIDIFGIDWGVNAQQTKSAARARRKSRVNVDDLSFEKFYDASSPYLFKAAARGKAFDEVVISVRKDSGEAHLDYLVITMENVLVTNYEMFHDKDDEGEQICESISLSFEKINFKYTVQADDHSAGDEHEVEYDVAAGV